MFSMLSNVWNTTYLKWLFIFLFGAVVLYMLYGLYSYFKDKNKESLGSACLFFMLIFITCYFIGCGLEVEKINANTRYEFITEDGIKHEGPSCYMTGGLFSTDGVYCKDYDGFTHTNVVSYNKIVEVPDEN